jgi:nitrogen regulatory protein P-II 1
VQGFKLIAAIVPKGAAGKVMDAAKEAGAEGGTILLGRGTGIHEARRLFGVSMNTEREMILILIDPDRARGVLDSIVRAGRLDEPGRGMAFVLSVDEVRGIVHRDLSGEAREGP